MALLPWKTISSPKHAVLKRVERLARSVRFRKQTGSCVVSGTQVVSELLDRGCQLVTVLAREETLPSTLQLKIADSIASTSNSSRTSNDESNNQPRQEQEGRCQIFDVGDKALQRTAQLESAGQGTATIVAEVKLPGHFQYWNKDDIDNGDQGVQQLLNCSPAPKRVVAIDSVSDPGNLGAIFRTSLAFGFTTAFLIGKCCDAFNPKVIRAARASQWGMQHIVIAPSWQPVFDFVDQRNAQFFTSCTDPSSQPLPLTSNQFPIPPTVGDSNDSDQPIVLAVGNESHGVHIDHVELERRARGIHIPMQNDVESLNVAVASALLMQRLN